ncbi:ribonuclease III [bacterium endosymbiont of Bathymodiolus sp. 5 South]|jgi:ribonuclease-3|uniref:ribonuclease III n=1 Tax=bacterium endosymbiont of Bathymodiolus sp. 5 South TaxID=1181670 RepID=UPI0010B2A81A|nr:ribonuclease III [bacterium endosymbiont of Bathymodiolus sp. 5 South]CAC9636582.1 Ribonuclease III (EC 3.1.26.3) [uncultured Gammaproteobacteria bacterium]CAC9647527.1 Ribonuclease III (EC 3.1.26.3) [uncultured Gammaproteobacteria bacterium]SHN89529.1 Ribonuclease III [bacterium endosymbiont of Bathymodiolus sp. 5 South]SSC07569.1 Ribonuclease III [bacterium endosymbiont of Bathymodiolus sp. 5 South]VVH59493.1 Ribonuclease III (EC [uncultured Gammaproteobacteria bacterium]
MNELQKKINYQFKDIALLRQALTHRSMGKGNNERLEFLGDSVLGVVVSRELYKRFPSIAEGKLSRFKSYVVRGQTLSLIATKLELSNLLILGSGELKSGGHNRKSIQSDAVEAILGAIFLEADFDIVNRVILDLFKEYIESINPNDTLKDFKTQLQERLQKFGQTLPQYDLIKTVGKDHNAKFTINCFLKDQSIQVQQEAKSIKRAEQMCAEVLLEKLKEQKAS